MNSYRYALILIILYRVRNWYYLQFYEVFIRYLGRFKSKVIISYFSRHRSVVSFSDYDNTEEVIDLQYQPQ